MIKLLLIIITFQFSFSQTDRLKDKLITNIKQIVEQADAVVGVAIKDLSSGEQILINEDDIFTKKKLELPGYYRSTKKWDLLVVSREQLVMAVELNPSAARMETI